MRLLTLAHEKLVLKNPKEVESFSSCLTSESDTSFGVYFHKNRASSVFVCFESRSENHEVVRDNSSYNNKGTKCIHQHVLLQMVFKACGLYSAMVLADGSSSDGGTDGPTCPSKC